MREPDPFRGPSEAEQYAEEIGRLEKTLSSVHLHLDVYAVPRQDAYGKTLTLIGRIDWLVDTHSPWKVNPQDNIERCTHHPDATHILVCATCLKESDDLTDEAEVDPLTREDIDGTILNGKARP